MSIDAMLSSFRRVPTSRFVFSSLAFHATPHGGELPGTWFIRALTPLGIDEQSIRQTLYRMESDGELTSRKSGRNKYYRATTTTQLIIDAGSARMRPRRLPKWDGHWTIVHFRLGEDARVVRDRLRDLLATEGFAALAPGVYVHPWDRSAPVEAAVRGTRSAARVQIFRGPRVYADVDDRRFVRDLWAIDAISERYRTFIRRFAPIERRRARLAPVDAAATRFALVFDYLEVAWQDPDFPSQLLSANWPGTRARALVDSLYRRLEPGALAWGAAAMQDGQREVPS